MADEQLEILVVSGVEGKSVYIDGYRVAGNKPWGGGTTLYTWKADRSDLLRALKIKEETK
jgi:hypothetical protein